MLPGTGTSRSSSGRGPTGALGTNGRARMLPGTGTSMSSSGRGPTGAPGTNTHARMLPGTGTSMSSSGRGPTGAPGTEMSGTSPSLRPSVPPSLRHRGRPPLRREDARVRCRDRALQDPRVGAREQVPERGLGRKHVRERACSLGF